MKLWVDDIREPPDDSWTWARSSDEAVLHLLCRPVEELSLDHDLGGDDTARSVILWMCETETWPETIHVHSVNPVGREWLEGMIKRYKT